MKKQRVLALVDETLVPPDDAQGPRRRQRALEDGVRRRPHAARGGPRGARGRGGRRARRHPPGDPGAEARTSPSTSSRRFADVATWDQNVVSYLELLRLPYTGLQPARPHAGARQVAVTKKILAYHRIPVPGLRRVPRRPGGAPAEAARLPADREVADRRSVDRHLAGLGGRGRRASSRSACASSTRASAPTPSSSSTSTGRELYVGILGNQRLQVLPGVGARTSRDCRRRPGASPPSA